MYARLRRLLKETSIYSVGNILGRSISVITMPIFTRYMSVSEYGILSLVRPFREFLTIFFDMGASASSTRFYYDQHDERYRVQLFSTLFIFMLVLSTGLALLLITFAEPIWNQFVEDVPFSPYVVVIILSALFFSPTVLTRTLFRVQGKARRFVELNTLYYLGVAAIGVPAVVLLDMGALGPLAATLIVSVAFFIINVYFLRKYLALTFSWPLLRKMLVFGLPEIPNQAGNWTLKTISQLILQHYWSVAAVGLFAVAFAIANILFELVINAIHWAVQPFYYQVGKEESREKAGEIFAYVATINTAVILFVGLFAILLGKELILIFASAKYAAAETAVVILAVSAIFQFLYFIPSRVFYLQKRTAYLTPLLLLAVGLNLVCGFLLIPEFGTVGAAWATLIAYAGRSLSALLLAQRVLFIPYDYPRIGKALAVFAVLVLARYLLPDLVSAPEVVLKLALLALFPLMLYAVGFFQEREVRAARRLWAKHVVTRFNRDGPGPRPGG